MRMIGFVIARRNDVFKTHNRNLLSHKPLLWGLLRSSQ